MAESYTLAAIYPDGDWFSIFDGNWKLLWSSKGISGALRLRD